MPAPRSRAAPSPCCPTERSRSCAGRATTAATASSRRRLLRERGARSTWSPSGSQTRHARSRSPTCAACPATRRSRSSELAGPLHRLRRRAPGYRLPRHSARRGRRAIARINDEGRARRRRRRAERRRRLHRRRCGRRGPAATTVTFHVGKPGLWIHPGKEHAGDVQVADIGIPRGAPARRRRTDRCRRRRAAAPPRPDSTKFSSGHVLVCGGSRGLTGAPCMASLAAARAGRRLRHRVRARVAAGLVSAHLLEVMTRGLPDDGDALTRTRRSRPCSASRSAAARSRWRSARVSVAATAPSRSPRELARRAPVPLVLDADGLNAHAGRLADLATRRSPTVLTPHAGELARLLDTSSDAVGRERLAHARSAAQPARRDRRAQGRRHARRRARRARCRERRREPRTRHRRHRRRAHRRRRRDARGRSRAVRGRVDGGVAARPGRAYGGAAHRAAPRA